MRRKHLSLFQIKRIELVAMTYAENITLPSRRTKRTSSPATSTSTSTKEFLNPSVKELTGSAFFISVSNHLPELVSSDGTLRIPLRSLDSDALVRAKNLAHNQYVNAMMTRSEDLDEHRATLNFLSKAIEKVGNPIARPHMSNSRINPERTPKRKTRSKTIKVSKAA